MRFSQFDVVRLTNIHKPLALQNDGINRRLPKIGDVAAVVEIYPCPLGYELECTDEEGVTEWLLTFASTDIDLEIVK